MVWGGDGRGRENDRGGHGGGGGGGGGGWRARSAPASHGPSFPWAHYGAMCVDDGAWAACAALRDAT